MHGFKSWSAEYEQGKYGSVGVASVRNGFDRVLQAFLSCLPLRVDKGRCGLIRNSTTVIVKIKGKPRSLFYNKRTVIGKFMHIIIDIENKSVELIFENNDVLVNFIT